jgi:hypothetical protein
MASNVYFWDLPGNAETAPVAGLSACNESEAHSVVDIASFLILCGTPPSSITIITPYKGQKNLIIKHLREAKMLPERALPDERIDGEDAAPITVSTVDNFQGDENDIILLSLVRCRPGNRFMELQNRFIVAMSRARLALFVVGCRDAVAKGYHNGKGPAHWVDFIKHLESTVDPAQPGVELAPRAGPALPVCCPRHATSTRAVQNRADFPIHAQWGQFCREVCTFQLPCKHSCDALCHSPAEQPHTQICRKVVERPCIAHESEPLCCGEIKRRVPTESLTDALSHFECEVVVQFNRPCGHTEAIPCFREKQIAATASSQCAVRIVCAN